jgi:uncharacterized protein
MERTAATPLAERILVLDVLRGFALFGVLLMNIPAMGLPEAAAFNPAAVGEPSNPEIAAWAAVSLLFEGGMRTLFSMLFGAGFLLFLERQEQRGADGVKLFVRRAALLVGFGVLDRVVFLWSGDILLPYGLAALVLLVFRWARLPVLAAMIGAFVLGSIVLSVFELELLRDLEAQAQAAQSEIDAGTAGPEAERAVQDWRATIAFWSPSSEDVDAMTARAQQGWSAVAIHQAREVFSIEGLVYFATVAADALLGMLLGVLAYRVGLIQGAWRASHLIALGVSAGLVGLAVNGWEIATLIAGDFSAVAYGTSLITYDIGRIALAVAWLTAIVLLMRTPAFARTAEILADVGRMALTNYLLQSIAAAILFVGFGLFGVFDRIALYGLAMLMFAGNVIVSRVWLSRFKLGPAEWVWRFGTYGPRRR